MTTTLPARTRLCIALSGLCLASACTAPPEHPALSGAALPPLIQAHRFAYQGTVAGGYQLSPDGRKLAWIGPSMLRGALFVKDLASGETKKYRARASFRWTPDSRRLLYEKDTSGAENTHVYMIDVAGNASEEVDLTPYPGVRAVIHQVVPGNPSHILVLHNRRDPRLKDLYRVDLDSRKETLVVNNPGDAVLPVTQRDGSFVRWQRSREAQRPLEMRALPSAQRRPLLQTKPEETFRVLGPGKDGSFVWALSSRGRDRVALVVAHPTLGWERVVFADPVVDVLNVTMSRVTRDPLIAQARPGYPRIEILDARLREDLAGLLKAQGDAPYGLDIVSTDDAERRMVVSVHTSSLHRYYLVDRSTSSHELLAETVDRDLSETLTPVTPVSFASRDGLQLHGYLTLPPGVSAKRLPMVLMVHGGPWLRSGWADPVRSTESADVHFLANRGYAVLEVDFRGSTGYGQRFHAAGMGEFAEGMQNDLLDAVRWAVDRGVADADRIAIMGWSYGGYAALVGLTQTPATFACGISLAGPTDLATLIESFPPYWKTDLTLWHDFVGQPGNPEDRAEMTRKSPLTHAQALQRPVLIMHGAADVRVRIDQSERMVKALRDAGKPVQYLRIEDMGHTPGWWVHRLKVMRTSEEFLHRCLGGRASRFDPFDAVAWVWTRISR